MQGHEYQNIRAYANTMRGTLKTNKVAILFNVGILKCECGMCWPCAKRFFIHGANRHFEDIADAKFNTCRVWCAQA
jgi:hypothetical protein